MSIYLHFRRLSLSSVHPALLKNADFDANVPPTTKNLAEQPNMAESSMTLRSSAGEHSVTLKQPQIGVANPKHGYLAASLS